jgi:hypothetical protein
MIPTPEFIFPFRASLIPQQAFALFHFLLTHPAVNSAYYKPALSTKNLLPQVHPFLISKN